MKHNTSSKKSIASTTMFTEVMGEMKKIHVVQRHLNSRNREYHDQHMRKEAKLKYA